MNKAIGICFLSLVFIIGLLASTDFAVADNEPTLSREENTDRPGMTYKQTSSHEMNIQMVLQGCENMCKNEPQCKAFSFEKMHMENFLPIPSRCYLKAGVPAAVPRQNFISGVKSLPLPPIQDTQIPPGTTSTSGTTPSLSKFKLNQNLLARPKIFIDEYYKIFDDFEAAANPILQKITKDVAAGKAAINEYRNNLDICSNQDHSLEECNPQETVEACQKRLLSNCLGSVTNNVASRYSDLNADLVQLKALVDKWGPIICNQSKNWSTIGSFRCNW